MAIFVIRMNIRNHVYKVYFVTTIMSPCVFRSHRDFFRKLWERQLLAPLCIVRSLED